MQVPTKEKDARELAYGNMSKFLLPSGYEVTIREQNGNDDDILTNKHTAKDMSNFDIFLSSIIIDTNLPFNVNGRITKEGAKKLLLRDKYFILLMSRINSLGNELEFEFKWDEKDDSCKYSEDLNNYVWDYSKPMPKSDEDNYFEDRIQPYNSGAYDLINIDTPSGKKLRFNLINGEGEKFLLALPVEQHSMNKELEARNLEVMGEDGKWVKIKNFGIFTSREMSYIRKVVSDVDPSLSLSTEVENPKVEGQKEKFLIFSLSGFFFPEGI